MIQPGVLAEYQHSISGAAIFECSANGKIEVAGPDAPMFLHNLSSNDVKALKPGEGCEAFLLTNKAKIIAHVVLYCRELKEGGPSFWLDLAPGMAGKVMQHLDHFLISEQVEFVDRTAAFGQVHLAGPQASAILARAGMESASLAELQHGTHGIGGILCQVRRRDGLGLPGYDLVFIAESADVVKSALRQAGASLAGPEAFDMLRIEAGTPVQGVDFDENTFAPELGRIRQAISYTKGCYLGQEPVVMARDRGQVNRSLMGVKLPEGPAAGSLLHREGKEVGRITSSVHSPFLDMAIGLAFLRRGNQGPGTKLEVEREGRLQPAEVVALPFRAPGAGSLKQ
jgi:folate-binding protein YgfZ